MKKKTIMIFGISSFVGSNLAEFLKNDFRVIGTYHFNPVIIPGVLAVQCDVLSRDSVQFLLYSFRPEITIYAVGLSSLEDCAKHEKFADALNTIGVFNVTTFTERYKSKFCFISSAYIFSGLNKTYLENDSPDPKTQLGRTKAAAEFFVQKSCLNYLIFRCSVLYGRSINPRQMTWFEILQYRMKKQEGIACDGQIHHGFLDVQYLAIIIKMCIEQDVTNRLFQISSTDILNYYEFGKLYVKIFGGNEGLVQKGNWIFPQMRSEYTGEDEDSKKFYHLSTQNLESFLNVEMPTVQEGLGFTLDRMGGTRGGGQVSSQKGAGIQFI